MVSGGADTLKDRDLEDKTKRPGRDDEGLVDLPLRPGPGASRDLEFDPLGAGGEPPPARREPGSGGLPPHAGDQRQAYHARPPRRRGPLVLVALLLLAALVWWLFPEPPRASFSSPDVAFETTRVGDATAEQVITVGNVGERRLAVTALVFSEGLEADYEVVEENCVGRKIEGGGACEIRLRFAPGSAGNRSGLLRLESNDRTDPAVGLEAAAVAPQLGLAPTKLSFGVLALEAQALEREVTLSNVGTATLDLGRIRIEGAAARDFSRSRRCPSARLEPGDACTFDVLFSPSVSGPRSANLVIESDAPEGPGLLPMDGVGLWEGPPLDPDSESLAFGEQRVGKRGAGRTLTFANRTGAPVSVDRAVVSGSSSFAIVDDRCQPQAIASGETCAITLTFLPVRDGGEDGTLTLSAEGATEPVVVGLRGRGVTPAVEVEPRAIDFTEQRLGFESAPLRARVKNTGTATLSPRAVSVSGPHGAEFVLGPNECVAKPLAPGKSCAVSVGFNPGKSGSREAVLVVDPGSELSPVRVSLAGTGVVSALRADPGKLDYRGVYLGRVESRTLTLTNAGSARLELRGLRFEGDDAGAFGLGKTGCSLDAGLGPGATCGIEIAFEPERTGTHRAQLTLDYNGPDSPARVELAGEGQEPAPVFRISAKSLDLGSARIAERGEIGTVTISNPGAAWLKLTSITLRGDHAESFQLVPGSCDGASALAPSGSCTVGVRVAPLIEGPLRATILVRHGAEPGTATVTLSARGLARLE